MSAHTIITLGYKSSDNYTIPTLGYGAGAPASVSPDLVFTLPERNLNFTLPERNMNFTLPERR